MLIDFSKCKRFLNVYDGNAQKFPIDYNGERYLLKLTEKLEVNEKNPMQTSYSNAPVAEHIGSHVFRFLGLPVQETLLGTYGDHMAVACKDFIRERDDLSRYTLVEFKKLAVSMVDGSSSLTRTPALKEVLRVFDHHEGLSGLRAEAKKRFWQTFVGDALIGNFDRHAGNWGYILDERKNALVELAPIYDCGSSLYPKLSEDVMEDMLASSEMLEERVLDFPLAALSVQGKKVRYHEFLLSEEGADCRKELLEMFPEMDLSLMQKFVKEIDGISDVRKEFYSRLLAVRSDCILLPAYQLAKQEQVKRDELKMKPEQEGTPEEKDKSKTFCL